MGAFAEEGIVGEGRPLQGGIVRGGHSPGEEGRIALEAGRRSRAAGGIRLDCTTLSLV